jgi:ATP-dependent Clp protease ATP-binding subunit ClpA
MSNFDHLLLLEEDLRKFIRGQDHVLPVVVDRVTIGETGLSTDGRPKASFFFVGPTGVGKTELARVLSHHLFDQQEPIRFDMTEFAADDAIKNFIGDHTGNLGRLGRALKEYRHGLLLFDEIEKAHPDVINVFIPILDAARVTCGAGELFDLSPFYIAFSSNLGALDILRARHLNFTQIEKHVLGQVAATFRPEFLGRINSKLVFKKLSYEVQLEIARLNLEREQQLLAARGINVTFDDEVLTFLLQVGFDKYLGARPLRDAMELVIRAPVSKYLLRHDRPVGKGRLRLNATRSALVFET